MATDTFSAGDSYTWGLDLTNALQGAGGVGGLLMANLPSDDYYYLYDANGNVGQLLRGADGTVAAEYEYGPFGELMRSSGSMALVNPFRFSTKYADDETGLTYYGLRYYDASLGRWLNRDPIGERGGLNLYGFVGNDGVNRWDLLGLQGACGRCKRKDGRKPYMVVTSSSVLNFFNSVMGSSVTYADLKCVVWGKKKCRRPCRTVDCRITLASSSVVSSGSGSEIAGAVGGFVDPQTGNIINAVSGGARNEALNEINSTVDSRVEAEFNAKKTEFAERCSGL